MKVGGHRVREHVRLVAPLLGLITGIWLLRLILASAGAPAWLSHAASLTAAAPIMMVLAVMLMHVRRFGSYANIVLVSLLLNAWTQLLICAAILFSVLTGMENVYTIPEFSMPGDDPHHLRHMYAHLTFGIGISTLIGAAVASLLLYLLRKLLPIRESEVRR